MRHAVTISTPASAAIGTFEMIGASTSIMMSRPTAWKMPVRRVCAPERTATEVRASAAVAGMPPNIGSTMLPTPCANSSWSLFSLTPVALPALAPHSRLSSILSTAMENAGASSAGTVAQSI